MTTNRKTTAALNLRDASIALRAAGFGKAFQAARPACIAAEREARDAGLTDSAIKHIHAAAAETVTKAKVARTIHVAN